MFTTNDKDKLDPALLRPGRMDVHVHMSYCTIDGFKLLATNYLEIKGDHQLYRQIEGLLKNVKVTPAEIAEELLKKVKVTPAEIAEELLKKVKVTPAEIAEEPLKKVDPDVVLRGVVKFLEQKEREKAKAAELKERLKERLKSAGIDVDAEGFVKFLKQKKIENAKAKEAERLLNSDDTDLDVEGLAEFIQKKIEDAKAAEKVNKSK